MCHKYIYILPSNTPFLRNASPLCKYWWDRAVAMFLAKGCHDPPVNGYQGPVVWPRGSFICKGFFGLAIPWPAGPQLGFRWISSIAHWRSSCPIAPWPGFTGPIPPVPKLPSPVPVTPWSKRYSITRLLRSLTRYMTTFGKK